MFCRFALQPLLNYLLGVRRSARQSSRDFARDLRRGGSARGKRQSKSDTGNVIAVYTLHDDDFSR